MASIGIRSVAFIVVIFFALAVFLGTFYTVDEGELGVVLTNGAVSSVSPAGLHFKLPVFQRVIKISTRTQTREFENVASYTSDRQTADVNISITFAIAPDAAEKVYTTYGEDGDGSRTAQIILDPKLYEHFKNIFGQFSAIAAVQRRAELNTQIENEIIKAMAGSGLNVQSVQIKNIDFSDDYERAIEASAEAQARVQTATNKLEEVKMEAQQQIVQAEAAAKAIRATADAQAYKTKVQADADAGAIKAKAEALKANQELVAWSAVDKWNGQLPVTMVPGAALPFINVK